MKYDKNQINRLKRLQGQLNGILKMMEEDKDCKDVVTQLSASRSGIERLIGVIVSENLAQCVKDSVKNETDTDDLVKEAVNLLIKSR
ncbi:metal-sensitive transcriptional regulator [Macrococcus armenti]|uniref:Metal-sensitive transcriptional regulator n=1 Tax=Macrococcus armenti TaxID=2875764 RepID=A0ABY3ZXC5_9STAP|nr:metal-sensitive transcriptional regulator [Macrococcus armenti]UBH09692.1 metal-sensitive transcriptional regulator [Macrococcus armenti]UBH11988.1 metal-sensitive transcriptional regulator [Macrococcus armenti]UBH16490.1 metal-sensitive transcriptional regulator [Macrococcus armenti]UBH18845.1 metal-sensitive transcriptional regulator [Macrococcus armenti]UBH21124.1 metal-sensitive transcriptional regulator [Macrococcus armenti]